MTQEEKFSLHLPYKPICIFNFLPNTLSIINKIELDRMFIKGCTKEGNYVPIAGLMKDCKTYLRSFDQLNKECVQADYNDGKPFIPKDELEKLFPNCHNWFYIIGKPHVLEYVSKTGFDKSNIEWSVIRQLLKWHFAIGFESYEYIEVNNENNPYI